MKVILAVVASINGKTTKGDITNVRLWTSKEDQKYFATLIQKSNLIVMGRETYEAARPVINLTPGKLRIVLTRSPERFKRLEVLGQLEFTNDSPTQLVKRMESDGYKTMLLVGGSIINSLFFQQNIIDEVWITIEPLIFGKGKGLVEETNLNVPLRLNTVKKLNKNGTLLLKYCVVYTDV
jgi:dihydrofolate reductase